MAACKNDASLNELELPAEFEDLEGLLRADLRAVVAMLTQRANERLLLTRREHHQLRAHALEQPDGRRQRGRRTALGRSSLTRASAWPDSLRVPRDPPRMSQIVLGVTGSVAALRVPSLFDGLRAARATASGSSRPSPRSTSSTRRDLALDPFDPLGGPGLPRRRRVGRRPLAPRRPRPAHRVPPLGRPPGRRPARRQHPGQIRARPLRQLPDLPVPRLGLRQARHPRPGDEYADVGQPGHEAAPPPAPRRPGRRPRKATTGPSTRPTPSSPVTSRAWSWSPAGQAARLRRRRPGGDGRGASHRRGRSPGPRLSPSRSLQFLLIEPL